MSYSVTGVATIPFPVHTLQDDRYSVPGSHRSIAPQPLSVQDGADLPATPGRGNAHAGANSSSPRVSAAGQSSPVDTVTLTTSQKVQKLQREGESALQIAAKLSLPAKEVLRDLHVDTHVPQSFTVAPVTSPLDGNTTATVSVPTSRA